MKPIMIVQVVVILTVACRTETLADDSTDYDNAYPSKNISRCAARSRFFDSSNACLRKYAEINLEKDAYLPYLSSRPCCQGNCYYRQRYKHKPYQLQIHRKIQALVDCRYFPLSIGRTIPAPPEPLSKKISGTLIAYTIRQARAPSLPLQRHFRPSVSKTSRWQDMRSTALRLSFLLTGNTSNSCFSYHRCIGTTVATPSKGGRKNETTGGFGNYGDGGDGCPRLGQR